MFITRLAVAAIATAALASPAAAAFVVNFGSAAAIPGNNDFKSQLNGLGQFLLADNAVVALDGPASIKFEFLGAESGFTDTFNAGSLSFTEANQNAFGAPILIGTDVFGAGPLTANFTSSGNMMVSTSGMQSFGVFLPSGTISPYSTNVLYFGFDDQITDIDDNHDDLIVRATLTEIDVPAPGALALFGLGLAVVGLRRRS